MAGSKWKSCTLGEVVEIKHGFAFQGEFFQDKPLGEILLTPGNFAIHGGCVLPPRPPRGLNEKCEQCLHN